MKMTKSRYQWVFRYKKIISFFFKKKNNQIIIKTRRKQMFGSHCFQLLFPVSRKKVACKTKYNKSFFFSLVLKATSPNSIFSFVTLHIESTGSSSSTTSSHPLFSSSVAPPSVSSFISLSSIALFLVLFWESK